MNHAALCVCVCVQCLGRAFVFLFFVMIAQHMVVPDGGFVLLFHRRRAEEGGEVHVSCKIKDQRSTEMSP